MNPEQLMQQLTRDWLALCFLSLLAFVFGFIGWGNVQKRWAGAVLIAASLAVAYLLSYFVPTRYGLPWVLAAALALSLTSYISFWWLPRLAKLLSRGFQSPGVRNFAAALLLLAWGFRWKIPVDGLAFIAIVLAFVGVFYDFESWKQSRHKTRGVR